jgi:hypothetical protein
MDTSTEWWRPAVDRGELREKIVLHPLNAPVEEAAELLSQRPIVTTAWENRTGSLPMTGSLATLTAPGVQLLALKPAANGGGLELRVKSFARTARRPILRLGRKTIRLGPVQPGEVATFRLVGASTRRVALGR